MSKKNEFLIFFLISLLWSLTFPLIKHMRLMGTNVWSISFYICLFTCLFVCIQKNIFFFFQKDILSDLKLLISLGILRNFFGLTILNYLLLSQSITNVSIALLFIPFTTLILDSLIDHFNPSKRQIKGISLSILSMMILIYDFNHINQIAWYYMPLTLLASLFFGIEAILLSKANHKATVILFWQNITGSILLLCFILYLQYNAVDNVTLMVPLNIFYIILIVSLLSITANNLFIRLTKYSGPSISTQINISIVLFSCVYDKALYGSVLMWHTPLLIILMILSIKLILHKT